MKFDRNELFKAGKTMRAGAAQSTLAYQRGEATGMMEDLEEHKEAWKALLAAGHVARRLTTMQAAE